MKHPQADTTPGNAAQATGIAQAHQLVQLLETGRIDEANQKLNELCRLRETELYQDIGKLTRELHEAFHTFNKDGDLHVLMKADMSDAREHLDYVIQTTESSAHQTLGAIENCAPLIEELADEAAALHQRLQDSMAGSAMDEEMHHVAGSMDVFLGRVKADFSRIRGSMTDVMTAQEYQDVTGQIIQRVIGIVQQLEKHLVDILRASARFADAESVRAADQQEQSTRDGRAEVNPRDSAMNQSDVDDLLDTLGF